MGLEVLFDDRTDVSPGQKFTDADLIGIPLRVIISPKTIEGGYFEVKERASGEVGNVASLQEIVEIVGQLLSEF